MKRNTETIMNELKFLKDGEIDETEIGKFIESILENDEWKPVLKTVVQDCRHSVKAKLPEVLKKMEANFKKDHCNAELEAIIVCVITKAFEVT